MRDIDYPPNAGKSARDIFIGVLACGGRDRARVADSSDPPTAPAQPSSGHELIKMLTERSRRPVVMALAAVTVVVVAPDMRGDRLPAIASRLAGIVGMQTGVPTRIGERREQHGRTTATDLGTDRRNRYGNAANYGSLSSLPYSTSMEMPPPRGIAGTAVWMVSDSSFSSLFFATRALWLWPGTSAAVLSGARARVRLPAHASNPAEHRSSRAIQLVLDVHTLADAASCQMT